MLITILNYFLDLTFKIIAYLTMEYLQIPRDIPFFNKQNNKNFMSIEERITNTPTHNSMYYMLDGYQPIVMITDQKTADKLYKSDQYKTISRNYPYLGYVMERLLKHSIGVHYGKEWLEMKKPLARFFNTQSVKNNFPKIVDKTKKWTNTLTDGCSLNFLQNCSHSLQNLNLDLLTIKIMSEIIYGELNDSQIDQLHKLSLVHNDMMKIMGTDKGSRIKFFNNFCQFFNIDHASLENKRKVDSFWNQWCEFNDSIQLTNKSTNQLSGKTNANTLYETMITDQRYSENKLEFYQTLYEIMLFNLDIMIDAFANLIWNISTNQEVKEKICREIVNIVPNIENINVDKINELTYLQSVINESARLNPGIVATFAETLNETLCLNNCTLHKGTLFSLDTQMINRDPSIWKDPNKFDPSRFEFSVDGKIDDKIDNKINSKSKESLFHRFGMSPRKCMGNVFSNYILKIGIVFLLSTYDIQSIHENIQIEKINTIPNISGCNMLNKIIFIKK